MRIAIYEPERINGGTSTWANHLRTGLRQLGHTAQIITFTRSGRPLKSWLAVPGRFDDLGDPITYDLIVPYRDATECLNRYDGIIFSDFLHPAQDKRAQAGLSTIISDLPDYVILARTIRKPFTIAIHTSDYSARRQPFADLFLDSTALTGWFVANSPDAVEHAAFKDRVIDGVTYAPLPFKPTGDHQVKIATAHPVVTLAGRYSVIKGHRVLAAAAAYGYLPDEVRVELHGTSDRGPGPVSSGHTFDVINETTEKVTSWIAHGTPYQDRSWWINTKSGFTANTVSYGGPFTDPATVFAPAVIACNLTAISIPGGSLEYSQLESIDAGCLQIAPAHRWDTRYLGRVISSETKWASDQQLVKHHAKYPYLEQIGDAVSDLLELDRTERLAVVNHNREVLRTVHDPKAIAQLYVDTLTNGKRN